MKILLTAFTFFLFNNISAQVKDKNSNTKYNTTIIKPKNVNITKSKVVINSSQSVNPSQNELLEKIYDEQTGGNSIPIVTAYTLEDIIPPEESLYELQKTMDYNPTGDYLEYIILQNKGDFKLIDVTVTLYVTGYRVPERADVLFSKSLLPNDSFKIYTNAITRVTKYDTTKPMENLYFIPNWNGGDDGDLKKVKVTWRNINYTYHYRVRGGGSRHLYISDYYEYKGKVYDMQGLIDELSRERTEQKKSKGLISNSKNKK